MSVEFYTEKRVCMLFELFEGKKKTENKNLSEYFTQLSSIFKGLFCCPRNSRLETRERKKKEKFR